MDSEQMILMLFSELIIEEVVELGLTDQQAEEAVQKVLRRMAHAYSSAEESQDNRASDCENVYYI